MYSLAALSAEITNDPEGLGYKNGATWKGDQEIADLINAKNLVIDRISVGMEEIRQAIEYDWYNNLAIDEQEYLRWQTPNSGEWKVSASMKGVLASRGLAVNGATGVYSAPLGWWAAANDQDAEPAMLALIEIPGSRAEVLWGEGRTITAGQVGAAANV